MIQDLDECTCECHEPDSSLMHIMACCSWCPWCARRVVDVHNQERCEREHREEYRLLVLEFVKAGDIQEAEVEEVLAAFKGSPFLEWVDLKWEPR